jgi:hypothetical protein
MGSENAVVHVAQEAARADELPGPVMIVLSLTLLCFAFIAFPSETHT